MTNQPNTRTPRRYDAQSEEDYEAFVRSIPDPQESNERLARTIEQEFAAVRQRRDALRSAGRYDEYIQQATSNPVNGRDEDTA